MKQLLQTLFFFLLVTQICFAQWKEETNITKQTNDVIPIKPHNTTHTLRKAPVSMHPSFYDRKSEWQTIIKEFWGPGESLAGKRATFDLYQNYARSYNATFVWNSINWDSLATVLRSRITDSTSRGEFSKILNDLSWGMRDGHCFAYDNVMLTTPLSPGTPILPDGGGYIAHFGAGLTPLADSSLLVYKVLPNHPLGLVPGDIILGYQGIPWHQLVNELLEGGVPNTIWIAAAPSAFYRTLLYAAGESWHLFDTIDVVKYSTGQVVHLPLDPMITLNTPANYINNEQLPIPGVPMPVFDLNSGAVTYGIIQGTNIGYIYVYHHQYPAVSSEFNAAVIALTGTDGLIIDIRNNWGGNYGLNDGISRLMNHSTRTMDTKKRCSPSNLYLLCDYTPQIWNGEIPSDIGTYYDRPIAVLLGPNCLSYGDISSWELSYIPNARMFGRSPSAIYSGLWNNIAPQPSRIGYQLQCTNTTNVDHYNPGVPRWGQEYPLFEEVWLTPEGVANGEDGVVTRAIEWMNNLVYAHEVASEKAYYEPEDTVHISTIIENPNSHQVSARGYLKTVQGVLIDSVDLVHQLDNSDGIRWSAKFNLPSGEDYYDISINAVDNTTGDQFATPNASRFTTAGPIVLDSIRFVKGATNYYNLRPFVRNEGTSLTISNAKIQLKCSDPWVSSIAGAISLPSIAAGTSAVASSWIVVSYVNSTFPGYFNLKAEISVDGWIYWMDSIRINVITGVEDEVAMPSAFKLEQNFPNPFNPTTSIQYAVSSRQFVSLKVYDVLGNEIATLVNEEKEAGRYEVEFNAEKLTSGVYFYQLLVSALQSKDGKAGSFVETKKMLLLR